MSDLAIISTYSVFLASYLVFALGKFPGMTLISVWRQVLIEDAETVTVNGQDYPARPTSRSKLHEVNFQFEGWALRGLDYGLGLRALVRRRILPVVTKERMLSRVGCDGRFGCPKQCTTKPEPPGSRCVAFDLR